MRNLVLDRRNQPVQQLIKNPNFDLASGTVVARTNLALDPRASNIARAAMWDGNNGVLTTLTQVGVSGVALYPTTNAYRLTFKEAAPTSLAAIGHGGSIEITGGVTYTVSAFARASNSQSLALEIKWFRADGTVIPGLVRNSFKQTPFQTAIRLSGNFAAPSDAAKMQVLVTTSSGGVVWPADSWIEATGFLVEDAGGVLRDYFDGTFAAHGDYTYAWTGNVHGSTSHQKAVGLAHTNINPAQTKGYRVQDSSATDGYAFRSELLTTANMGINVLADYNVVSNGSMATILMRVKASRTMSVRPRAFITQSDSSSILPADEWVVIRHKIVLTSPSANPYTGLLIASNSGHQVGDYIDIDYLMMVPGSYDGPFTAATGYPESPLLVRNLALRPFAGLGYGYSVTSMPGGATSTTNSYETVGGPKGLPYFRGKSGPGSGTAPASGSDFGFSGAVLGLYPDLTLGASAKVRPLVTYSFSVWVRSSVARPVRLQTQFVYKNASAGSKNSADQMLAPNTWTRLSFVGETTANAQAVRLDIDHGVGAPAFVEGETFDITGIMITEGPTLHDYADGNTPGWKWDGAAGTSTSYGYSYTLDAVFGKKFDADLVGKGGNVTVVAPPKESRVVHMVYDVHTVMANGTVVVRVGGDNVLMSRFRLVAGATADALSVSAIVARNGGTQDSTIGGPVIPGIGTIGRHIATFIFHDDMKKLTTIADGVDRGTLDLGSNDGLVDARLWTYAMPTNSGVALHASLGEFNIETTKAVHRWLANKYGATLAA